MNVKKEKTGSVRIAPDVLIAAKKICLDKDMKIKDFVNQAVKEKVSKEQRKAYAGV